MEKWSICRICMKDSGRRMQKIFTDDSGDEHLVKKIEQCGGVQLERSMNMPNWMCEKCLLLLRVAYKFRVTCQRSDKQLRKQYNLTLTINSPSPDLANVEETVEQEDIPRETPVSVLGNEKLEDAKNCETGMRQLLDFVMTDSVEETLAELQHELKELCEDVAQQSEESTTNIDNDNELQPNDEEAEDHDKDSNDNNMDMECCNEEEVDECERKSMSADDDIKLVAVSSKSDGDANAVSNEYKIVSKFTKTRSNDKPQPQKNCTSTVIEAPTTRSRLKHKNEDKFVCAVCGNVYLDRTKLTMHLKIHSKLKPHECEICHKRFAQTPQLARHMNTHTGNRPYKCNYCPSSFADPSTLCKHERIHTNERPYKCAACGKMFAYTNVLKVHMMMHSGEKPHQCTYCGKKFSQLHHMRTHERIHQTGQSGQRQ